MTSERATEPSGAGGVGAATASSPDPLGAVSAFLPNPVGVRAKQRKDTTAGIERAALHLAIERGFDAVTCADIAEVVGISTRTLFRYFPGGKEEALTAHLIRNMDHIRHAMELRPPYENALEALCNSIIEVADIWDENRDSVVLRGRITSSVPALSARVLEADIALARALTHMVALRLGVDSRIDQLPTVMVGAALAALRAAYSTWLEGSDRTFRDLTCEALGMIRTGLAEHVSRGGNRST